jgi:integration host factor subunit alpha
MTHTKSDIIDDIVVKTGLDRKTAAEGFETFMEIIKTCLNNGEGVSLSGFGRFSVREKRARRGRNPKTGEEIMITPRRSISFSLSNVFKAKLDREK